MGMIRPMHITVAVCTWNRCESLRRTLKQMTMLVVPDEVSWELLVINNNSSDRTEDVARSFASSLPIRHIFEPRPGLSNARNRAVSEAAGEYILWTDDDILVDPGWLVCYCEAFTKWPNASIFGGPIEAVFEGHPPDWLKQVCTRVSDAFAIRELGEHATRFTHDLVPYGANFALRLEEQRCYPYDPQLGVGPKNVVRGEETTVVRNMLSDGAIGWWVPPARVRHLIPKSRQTISYLGGYFSGRSVFWGWQHAASARSIFWPQLKRTLLFEIRFQVRRYLRQPEVWIEDLIWSSICWGILRGLLQGSQAATTDGIKETSES